MIGVWIGCSIGAEDEQNGCWFLVVGCWFLVVGFWLLVICWEGMEGLEKQY